MEQLINPPSFSEQMEQGISPLTGLAFDESSITDFTPAPRTNIEGVKAVSYTHLTLPTTPYV